MPITPFINHFTSARFSAGKPAFKAPQTAASSRNQSSKKKTDFLDAITAPALASSTATRLASLPTNNMHQLPTKKSVSFSENTTIHEITRLQLPGEERQLIRTKYFDQIKRTRAKIFDIDKYITGIQKNLGAERRP